MAKLSLVAASLLVAGSLAFIGAALRMGLADDIKATVGANDVTVYSKSTCPFCKRTKASLADLGISAATTTCRPPSRLGSSRRCSSEYRRDGAQRGRPPQIKSAARRRFLGRNIAN